MFINKLQIFTAVSWSSGLSYTASILHLSRTVFLPYQHQNQKLDRYWKI